MRETYSTGGAAAAVQPRPQIHEVERSAAQQARAAAAAASQGSGEAAAASPRVYQPPLFRDYGDSKVVPIPTLTPVRPAEREPSSRRSRSSATRSHRRVSEAQQALQFSDAEVQPQRHAAGEIIYCDAPVAQPVHRLLSAAVDGGMILAGVVLFLAVFLVLGGQLLLDQTTLYVLAGVTAAVTILYRSLWAVANGDTPGMRAAHLRLVDFDGQRPQLEQRIVRQVSGVLSLAAAGVGLLWALVDEESLTWHDHISKTFPTVR